MRKHLGWKTLGVIQTEDIYLTKMVCQMREDFDLVGGLLSINFVHPMCFL